MARARLVLTDSGGIQEETTALGIPCLTLRQNTERPVTVTHGTNRLVGTDRAEIRQCVDRILRGEWPSGRSVPLWDGRASSRIVDVLAGAVPA
jgi:UDP-N-acetylglucosamine 2-epimerase (non-hydrolysing)